MKSAPLHPNEIARQAAVDQLHLTGDEFEESFDRLTRLIRYVLGVSISAFSIIDHERQYFKSIQGLDTRETPRDVAFCAQAILGDDTLVVEDAHLDQRFAENPLVTGDPKIRFYAGIPIRAHNGMPIGTLCAIDSKPRELTKDQLQLMKDLRDILEETLLLRSLSVRDPLSGLFNRSYFDSFFEREWRRGYRGTLPLSVLLINIDHFRAYNNILGFAAGDQALKMVARHLSGQLRRGGDIAARFGNDAFVIVLPDTEVSDAAGVAVHLRESVKKLGIEHPASPDHVLTVSVGVASAKSHEDYLLGHPVLLARAQAAVDEAKYAGRDKVQVR